MSRKVQIKIEVEISIIVNDDVEISEIVDEIEPHFTVPSCRANVLDFQVTDHEVLDSK